MRVLKGSHDIVSKSMSSVSSMKPFSGKQYICRQFNTGNSLHSKNIGENTNLSIMLRIGSVNRKGKLK